MTAMPILDAILSKEEQEKLWAVVSPVRVEQFRLFIEARDANRAAAERHPIRSAELEQDRHHAEIASVMHQRSGVGS